MTMAQNPPSSTPLKSSKPSLIGSIIERKPKSSFPTKPTGSSQTGFPPVYHRLSSGSSSQSSGKSAFSRYREEQRRLNTNRPKEVPAVVPVGTAVKNSRANGNINGDHNIHINVRKPPTHTYTSPPPFEPTGTIASADRNADDDWRESISREHANRVASMTQEEIEEERRQIVERFGSDVGDVLRRAKLAREKKRNREEKVNMNEQGHSQEPVPIVEERARSPSPHRSPPPSALASPSSTRPSSRAERVLRFADLEPSDVHVYDTAPSTPKHKALALPPPDSNANDVVLLGKFKGRMVPERAGEVYVPQSPPAVTPDANEDTEPEEGSAEYIRRNFFPHLPKDDPTLAWMDVDPSVIDVSSTQALRFDLHGNPISPSDSLKLPTHLGLHHHAEGAHAGYTLDDIFLLSRSTVPAQRATMLSVLARIAHRLEGVKNGNADGMQELVGKEEESRKRILAAGVEAMSSRGNVGAYAIEIIWECIVGWEPQVMDLEGVELESAKDTTINDLPIDFVLQQITLILNQGGAAPESATQLLSVLHRFAQHSNTIATSIVSTPKMLSSILQTFLLSSPSLPDPLALQLFTTLALSSRFNALEITKYADPLLRFVTYSSFDSPYPPALAISLLTHTLRLYLALASYGLYTHIAGTAVEQLTHIEQYVVSEACDSVPLSVAWAEIVEVWTTCALDPHRTTPPHDVKWSQVTAWGWNMGMAEMQDRLEVGGKDEKERCGMWRMWRASWNAQSAWLEGAKVNAVRAGEEERNEIMNNVREGFESGKQKMVIEGVLDVLEEELGAYINNQNHYRLKKMAEHVAILSSVIRLWLACLPPRLEGVPSSPPFSLPYYRLSELARVLLVHPLWSVNSTDDPFVRISHRTFSLFLYSYLRLSKRLPDTSSGLYLAQLFSILLRLGPGDEEFANVLFSKELPELLTPQWAEKNRIPVSSAIWGKGGFLKVLEPFLRYMIRPKGMIEGDDDDAEDGNGDEIVIGPLTISPASIASSTTQRLPSLKSSSKSKKHSLLGLPLRRDWSTTPLDHLLRSGDSPVFRYLLHPSHPDSSSSWDYSEIELTRASLFLTKVLQEALLNFSETMGRFVMSREEAVFGCMKVFMLEHGQVMVAPGGVGVGGEDSSEEVFRDEMVERLMREILKPYVYKSQDRRILSSSSSPSPSHSLESLSPQIPFFQLYTDFLALYDSISFSHPTFTLLLLPPTSMAYPIDYRRLLWCDYSHLLRMIRVESEDVLVGDVREYMYPVERDGQVGKAMLGALLGVKTSGVSGFMRLLATHHVASNIWPDLQALDPTYPPSHDEDSPSTLFKAIVTQANLDVIHDVVLYHQIPPSSGTEALLPPTCFKGLSEQVKSSRMEYISKWGGPKMVDRLKGLFEQ